MKKLFVYFSLFVLCFTSCKKIINVETESSEPQLVIEGNITDKFVAQQIKISRSVPYTSQNIYPSVSGASVILTDNRGNTFNFAESQPGLYAFGMRGVPGVTYTLQVKVDGKTYIANSKMPALVKLDSIGILSNTFFNTERKTAAAFLTDPLNDVNFYHFNLYVNDVLSKRIYVNNDRLTNGNKLRIQLYYEKNEDDDKGLMTGDNVAVEMETIDSNIFDYWYSLSQQSDRGPNQGTTPSNPTSNISNGALGYFSAHTFQRISIKVP